MSMSIYLLVALFLHAAGASVCFSLPPTPAGAAPYTEADCGVAMPATGYPIGTQCSIPSVGCASPSLSKATCLDGVVNNEGYWSQPVCTVSAQAGFATSEEATTIVTTVANTEYAALVHLDDLFTTTSFRVGFTGGIVDSNVVVNIYTLQDPVGPTAGPGDLIYSVSGAFTAAPGSTVSTSTGFEVVSSLNGGGSGPDGDLVFVFPTPLNFGNDFYISITLSAGGLMVPMECSGGSNARQYWSRTSASNPFVATNVAGAFYGCIAYEVYVLAGSNGPTCPPTLLTATVAYDNGQQPEEPPMPYLDYTRSGLTGGPYLDLNFTFPTGVYDDIQFIPYAGAEAFGPQPTPTLGISGAQPCGTTFQVFKQSTSGCQSTATVRSNFLELISATAGGVAVCGWTLAPAPVQYQGVFYSQWSGTIQIVTYQTVALFGAVSMRIKEAYANVVVRSPIVTSKATASPVAVTDAATFQWVVVNQNLNSDNLPYTSTTNLQTKVTSGYELTATASITSGSVPTGWTLSGGAGPLTASACTGTSACTQAWTVVVENPDSAVCSLDAVVTVNFVTHCNAQLISSGGCDSNVDGRTFVATVVLSSVDFCRVVGGVTSLTMSAPALQAPSTSIAASQQFLTNAALNSFPAVPSIYVVGSSIGVYFSIASQPQIPLTVSAVSAKIYDANERSHFSQYADVTANVDGQGGPYFYVTSPAVAAPATSVFFNLPTGDQGTGTIYTPWLLTNAGVVNNIIVSVTCSVQYDNVLLGSGPHFMTFEIPLSPAQAAELAAASAALAASPLKALASAIRARPQSIQTGTITQETSPVAIQQPQASSNNMAMSTATIAGVAAGGAVALAVVVVIAVAVAKGVCARAASGAKYAAPAAAAAPAGAATAVGAPSVGPEPTASIHEDFYAPRIGATNV